MGKAGRLADRLEIPIRVVVDGLVVVGRGDVEPKLVKLLLERGELRCERSRPGLLGTSRRPSLRRRPWSCFSLYFSCDIIRRTG